MGLRNPTPWCLFNKTNQNVQIASAISSGDGSIYRSPSLKFEPDDIKPIIMARESTQIHRLESNSTAETSPTIYTDRAFSPHEIDGKSTKKRKLNVSDVEAYVVCHSCGHNKRYKTIHYCQFCPESFDLEKDIEKHTRTKHGDQFPVQCKNCSLGFTNENAWQLHEFKCRKRKYVCYLCKDVCGSKYILVNHMKNKHMGEDSKPYGCKKCTKRFCREWHLLRHMKIHRKK